MPAPIVAAAATALGPTIVSTAGKLGEAIIGIFKKKQDNKLTEIEAEAEIERIVATQLQEVETTYRKELELQQAVMVEELKQGDTFTKRARPSIIYAGLAVMVYNGVVRVFAADLAQIIAHFTGSAFVLQLTPVTLPDMLWVSWGGVVATYAVGRTREKVGAEPGKLIRIIYGDKEE